MSAGIDQLLPEILVLSLCDGKETKVHLEVPEDGVEGGDELDDEPDVEHDLSLHHMVEQTKLIRVKHQPAPREDNKPGEVGQHGG